MHQEAAQELINVELHRRVALAAFTPIVFPLEGNHPAFVSDEAPFEMAMRWVYRDRFKIVKMFI
jgi:hypothetical protein